MDFAGPRFTIYDEDGERIQDALAGIRPGRFRVVSESVAVVGSMDRRPALAGYPLHSINLNTGEQLRHFGSTDGEWSASGPFAQDVVLGYAMEPQIVWHGQRSQLLLEEWHVDDGLVRRITGELHWLRQQSTAERGPPPPHILSFGVDAGDRLWLIVRVPDPEWRSVQPRGSEGLIVDEDMSKYFDTRIDVFDLRARRHLGSVQWDESYAGLVVTEHGFRARKVEYDAESVPRVMLYALDGT